MRSKINQRALAKRTCATELRSCAMASAAFSAYEPRLFNTPLTAFHL